MKIFTFTFVMFAAEGIECNVMLSDRSALPLSYPQVQVLFINKNNEEFEGVRK